MKTQFKPGESGNPKGRPPTTTEREAFLKDRLTPRTRILFNGFLRKIGRDRIDVTVEADCLRVAELQVGCEILRLKMQTEQPTPALVNSITRLESTSARAERALFKVVPPKAEVHVPLREKLLKQRAKSQGDEI
jgi:hypothetical protein